MTPERWSAALAVDWRPILPYGSRRARLLDWFDRNLSITAFTESDDEIGIALGAHRLTVNRYGCRLMVLEREASVAHLSAALDATFEIMSPWDAVVGNYLAAWSVPTDGEYADLCRAFAAWLTNLSNADLGQPFDASAMVDFRDEDGWTQIEFGIVNDSELRDRLVEPRMSRIARTLGKARGPAMGIPGDLPDVSLFADVFWRAHKPVDISTGPAIVEVFDRTEAVVRPLVQALQQAL